MRFAPKGHSFKRWFTSRGKQVLPYQQKVLTKHLPRALEETGKAVLAMAPASGKTLTSIAFEEGFFKANPKARGIVLAHGTADLRWQYFVELQKANPNFSYELVESGEAALKSKANLLVTLPQTLSRVVDSLGRFDLLIVDEAHHYYFAEKMVKAIIDRVRPRYQILLTGTPSVFVGREWPIIPVTLCTLYDYGMVDDFLVEVASTTHYGFERKDYNGRDILKNTTRIRRSDTRATVVEMLNLVVKRLRTAVRDYPQAYAGMRRITGWPVALRELHKSLIACTSQAQAKDVLEFLEGKGINAAMSISDTDKDSLEIKRFRRDPECLVLIVVDRAVLGFNLPELENVVDLTCSHNVNRIFQLMNRVSRPHPASRKKMYFKVAPNHLEEYFDHVVNAAVHLCHEEWYTKFNGKNFDQMTIPAKLEGTKPGDGERKGKRKPGRIKPARISGMGALSWLKGILHKGNDSLTSYAYVTMGEVRGKMYLEHRRWTDEEIIEDARKYGTNKEWREGSPSMYVMAYKRGIAEECCAHMQMLTKPKGYWTKQRCKEDALLYNTVSDWVSNSPSAYQTAHKHGWLEECCAHMVEGCKPVGYWTEERILVEARKHSSGIEWKRAGGGSWPAAQRLGILEKCRAHMPKNPMPGTCLIKRTGRWSAYIYHKGHRYPLKGHDTREEAYAVHLKAKKRIARGLHPTKKQKL